MGVPTARERGTHEQHAIEIEKTASASRADCRDQIRGPRFRIGYIRYTRHDYTHVTEFEKVPRRSIDTSIGPPKRFRSTFCTAPPPADFCSAVPSDTMSPAPSVGEWDRNASTCGTL